MNVSKRLTNSRAVIGQQREQRAFSGSCAARGLPQSLRQQDLCLPFWDFVGFFTKEKDELASACDVMFWYCINLDRLPGGYIRGDWGEKLLEALIGKIGKGQNYRENPWCSCECYWLSGAGIKLIVRISFSGHRRVFVLLKLSS